MNDATAEPVLLVEDIGPVRRLTMNRPQALNALNHELSEAISGAIRAAGAAGQVWVSAACRRGMVEFCVEDSGPGYDGEPRSELSLGLSITERVARAQWGRVEAGVSDWLGGAAFRLLLPNPKR